MGTKTQKVSENIIVLRSVFGKVGNKYYINPCKDPNTKLFPKCVRRVNSYGDMILSDEDKKLPDMGVLIPEDSVFIIEDGTTYNLDNPVQAAQWESIKFCKLIAPERGAKDQHGNYIIDGTINKQHPHTQRYGRAELYIENPGQETAKKISKKKLLHDARTYVFGDDMESLLLRARLLGRDMRNLPLADVQDYLIEIAERDPNKIIDIYTGSDMNIRLLLIDARQKNVIYVKSGVYMYADNVSLGASDDAAVSFLKSPSNARIKELIERDTYPARFEITNPYAIEALTKSGDLPQKETPKPVKKAQS